MKEMLFLEGTELIGEIKYTIERHLYHCIVCTPKTFDFILKQMKEINELDKYEIDFLSGFNVIYKKRVLILDVINSRCFEKV